jgi:hypothetical protein
LSCAQVATVQHRFEDIFRGNAGGKLSRVDITGYVPIYNVKCTVRFAISTVVAGRVAGAQGGAAVLRARIEDTVENRQVSGVTIAVKMTYGRGAAKTGTAVEAARERRTT